MTLEIRRSRASDLERARALLARSRLPLAGVDEHFERFLVAEEDDRLVGTVGLEVHADVGLLRSLAVEPSARGQGLGQSLTRAALAAARDAGVATVYLLTTTADGFFLRFGFAVVPREEVEQRAGRSRELQGACPSTAACMRLDLQPASSASGPSSGSPGWPRRSI